MSESEVVIVGAGVTGRLAKVMRPDALLLEAAARGKQRIAAMVGVNYLHEEIPELEVHPITVYTGYAKNGYRPTMPAILPHGLAALDGVSMMRYQRKCRGWGERTRPEDGTMHIEERGKRYAYKREAWAYDTPDVPVQYDSTVSQVQPANHVLCYYIPDHAGRQEPCFVSYKVLIWTAPLNALYRAMGFDPTTMSLTGRPIFYKSIEHENDTALKDAIIVEYVPDENTPVYRRSVYYTEEKISISVESMHQIDGFAKFWPGKIDASDEARYLESICRDHDIILAGRFARWDPDELTHHTAQRLRSVLA